MKTNKMQAWVASLLPLVLLCSLSAVTSYIHSASPIQDEYKPNGEPDTLQSYIVLVEPPAAVVLAGAKASETWYRSFLPESSSVDGSKPRLLYSYTHVFSGFAARLTKDELESMSKKAGFVRAFPDRMMELMTTHTPGFLGLQPGTGLWNASSLGKGVIIGLLDSGIFATHPSFADNGVPTPPSKWKGSCKLKSGCNNKLIGLTSLLDDEGLDLEGHGTHTASTAGGNFVPNAQAYGLANGTAAGMAPHAHLAMYKVCDDFGCSASALVAGMDTAIKDGVDIISMSIGGESLPFDKDPIAIGAFGAIEKGVVVVCAGGNQGPFPGYVTNEAPWILTVAASTTDRSFRATIKLGNRVEFKAESLNQQSNISSKSFPLSYYKDCLFNSSGIDVKGKVAVCDPGLQGPPIAVDTIIKLAGGVAMIMVNSKAAGYTILDREFDLPTSRVTATDGAKIVSYANSDRNPRASITFDGTVLGVSPSPVVAYFSSRGPSKASPGILKPDISAPGLNVMAAWPTQVGLGHDGDKTFNIISGTSMATPHVSGIAALLKSLHPDWSVAAIKSAILTTSDFKGRDRKPILNQQHHKASFFAMGAGHVNPSKAADPGLVYDLGVKDYIAYICGLLGDSGVKTITRNNISCSNVKAISEAELNYPAIKLSVGPRPVSVNRTVTNVGEPNSRYIVMVDIPELVSVHVEPSVLQFLKAKERKTFTVSANWKGQPREGFVQGNLRLVSDKHVVRSPIIISK